MATPTPYRERLYPQWWAWLVCLSFVGMVAVAYGAAIGSTWGWWIGLGGSAFVIWLLMITAPVITAGPDGLGVAGAVLPISAIGTVEVCDGERVRVLRGPGSDGRIFVSLRPWSASRCLLVEVRDPQDPHPSWLFSTRHPERLSDTLTGTMATAPESTDHINGGPHVSEQ